MKADKFPGEQCLESLRGSFMKILRKTVTRNVACNFLRSAQLARGTATTRTHMSLPHVAPRVSILFPNFPSACSLYRSQMRCPGRRRIIFWLQEEAETDEAVCVAADVFLRRHRDSPPRYFDARQGTGIVSLAQTRGIRTPVAARAAALAIGRKE